MNQSFIQQTYKELNEGVSKGYGANYDIVDSKGLPNGRVIDMKRNLYKFAAAKNTAMMTEINSLLYDSNRLKSFDEFKASLDSLNIKYNLNWLKTEYRTAVQSGHSAKAWEAFQHNKERFPNLRYTSQGDDKVREEHEVLNGFVAHIDDPIWGNIAPPSGWNCRCYLVQTAEPTSKLTPDWEKEVAPEFRINTGETGQIYNENTTTGHRFFALAKDTPGWQKRFELSKLEGGYEKVKTPGGGKMKVSIYYDEGEPRNLTIGMIMVDQLNAKVSINAHTDGRVLLKRSNPEFDFNGKTADRKSPEGRKLRHLFKEANDKKKCEVIIFDMENYPFDYDFLLIKIGESLKNTSNYTNIKEVVIIDKNGKAFHFNRSEFQ